MGRNPMGLSQRERLVDLYARMTAGAPICESCATRMRWRDGCWWCPNMLRDDHRVETDDGREVYTTRPDGRI